MYVSCQEIVAVFLLICNVIEYVYHEVIQESKEVGVARRTNKLLSVFFSHFLLIVKHKFYINGFVNNSSFQHGIHVTKNFVFYKT